MATTSCESRGAAPLDAPGGYAHVYAPDDSLVHVGIHAGDRLTIWQPNVHNHGDWRAGDVALVEHAEPTARRSPEVA